MSDDHDDLHTLLLAADRIGQQAHLSDADGRALLGIITRLANRYLKGEA